MLKSCRIVEVSGKGLKGTAENHEIFQPGIPADIRVTRHLPNKSLGKAKVKVTLVQATKTQKGD